MKQGHGNAQPAAVVATVVVITKAALCRTIRLTILSVAC